MKSLIAARLAVLRACIGMVAVAAIASTAFAQAPAHKEFTPEIGQAGTVFLKLFGIGW